MNFMSDNAAGVAPEILAALARVNEGLAAGYGGDEITKRVERRFAAIFERDVAVHLVATGTAANALSLSVLCPPWGAVFCHEASHIQTDECGAPEFFTGGAKLIPLSGEHGKITAEALERAVTPLPAGVVHHVQPKVVSLTQLTECGTVYTPGEVRAIADFAHDNGMAVHMDGSRFANALATLGCTAAEITWQAGVDVLSFGATKNGAMAAEAVIFFDPAKAGDIEFRRKRAGHLWSKSRFLAAQFDAYLADDLWLRLAAHANAMARRLADGLAGIDGVTLIHPVEGNEVFATLPEGMAGRLLAAGARFYPWIYPGDATAGGTIRLMTFFCTRDEDVESFVSLCRKEAP